MTKTLRTAFVAAAAVATLAFANAALAANTATFSVWHTPMVLAGSQSTTIHFNIPQTTDGIAVVNIYVPSGYGATLGQAAASTIGRTGSTQGERLVTIPASTPTTTSRNMQFLAPLTSVRTARGRGPRVWPWH